MREGDKFLRYDSTANGTRVVIEREEPDLPTEKGTIGYAVIDRDGGRQGGVLLVRIYGPGTTHPSPWISPFGTGAHHSVADDMIVEFEPVVVHKEVSYGDVRDVFYDFNTGPAPSNGLTQALTKLANEGAQ
jgi:hypothetical protein